MRGSVRSINSLVSRVKLFRELLSRANVAEKVLLISPMTLITWLNTDRMAEVTVPNGLAVLFTPFPMDFGRLDSMSIIPPIVLRNGRGSRTIRVSNSVGTVVMIFPVTRRTWGSMPPSMALTSLVSRRSRVFTLVPLPLRFAS